MGQAMARVLLAAGHPLTVWNRTAARADDLVAAGAICASTPAEALGSPLVILSLTDYEAMYNIFGNVDPAHRWAEWANTHLVTGARPAKIPASRPRL
jgi:3-hydroxyisobutyrate dehydrogenase-like beta-hydroxyacid dehydrogenase